jgi:pimeloyl-ACP methyl ester carboxylesterase
MKESAMRKGYIDTFGFGQLHYLSAGTGDDLLLIHQAPLSSAEFLETIPLLAGRRRVWALDLPGHGMSDDPPRELEIEDYARAVAGAMAALGIGHYAVYGHNLGSAIAIELAATFPGRVTGLMISGSSHPGLPPPPRLQALMGKPLSRELALERDGGAILETWRRYLAMCVPGAVPQTVFKPFVLGLAARSRPFDAHACAFRYRKAERLPLVKCPVLLLDGSEDFYVDQLDDYAKLFKACRTKVIPGAGPQLTFEQPRALAEALLDFLAAPP